MSAITVNWQPRPDLPPIHLELSGTERVSPYKRSVVQFVTDSDTKRIMGKEELVWDVDYQSDFAAWCREAADTMVKRVARDAAERTVETMRPQLIGFGYKGEQLQHHLSAVRQDVEQGAQTAWRLPIERSLLHDYGAALDEAIAEALAEQERAE